MANQGTVNRLFNLLVRDPQVSWRINENGEAVVCVRTISTPLTDNYASITYKRIIHCKKRILEDLKAESFLLEIEGYQIGGLNVTNSFLARLNSPISYGAGAPVRVPKVRKPEFEIIFRAVESFARKTSIRVIEGQLQIDVVAKAA